MPLDYLRVLADKPMPFTVSDEDDFDKVQVLKAAGCIEVEPVESNADTAIVIAITPLGFTKLASKET